jgi:hypothetical protein
MRPKVVKGGQNAAERVIQRKNTVKSLMGRCGS